MAGVGRWLRAPMFDGKERLQVLFQPCAGPSAPPFTARHRSTTAPTEPGLSAGLPVGKGSKAVHPSDLRTPSCCQSLSSLSS